MAEVDNISRYLFRLIHIDNLKDILQNGIYAPACQHNPQYINIGDEDLIQHRSEFSVPIEPGGTLSDYIPFYFGGHSPMLLNIKTGYRGVTQRDQKDLVYLCTHIRNIIEGCSSWCFTDGHAKDSLTSYYNRIEDLVNVEWSIVGMKYWYNDENNPDRMRRKQAEFLVKNHIPIKCISGIIVYDQSVKEKIVAFMVETGCVLPIYVDCDHKYFFEQ